MSGSADGLWCIGAKLNAVPMKSEKPKLGGRGYLFMAKHDDREPKPQEAQRDGQGAISQDSLLTELHQEGEAAMIRRSAGRSLLLN
jgi:hypothetical protein